MPAIRKITKTFTTDSPLYTPRGLDLQGWDEEQGQLTAKREDIQLTDEHWEVVYCLRDYYLQYGPAKNGRELGDMLDNKFADRGGRKYLRRLFPNGPVAKGMRIAGLNVPPHTENEVFGTSR